MNEPTPSPEEGPKPPIAVYLTMWDLQAAHGVLAEVFKDDPEPVPAWAQGRRDALETCRGCIEVEAFGVKKYPDLPSAVAKIFYSTIKMHAFPNGNKRFALVLALLLLIKNGYTLTAASGVGAETAKWVAQSDPHDPASTPDVMVATLAEFYAANIAPRSREIGADAEL